MKYVSRFLKKKYDKELVYVRKYLNTKIEYYNDKWPTNFHYNEIQSKENIDKYVLKNISLQKKNNNSNNDDNNDNNNNKSTFWS